LKVHRIWKYNLTLLGKW